MNKKSFGYYLLMLGLLILIALPLILLLYLSPVNELWFYIIIVIIIFTLIAAFYDLKKIFSRK